MRTRSRYKLVVTGAIAHAAAGKRIMCPCLTEDYLLHFTRSCLRYIDAQAALAGTRYGGKGKRLRVITFPSGGCLRIEITGD